MRCILIIFILLLSSNIASSEVTITDQILFQIDDNVFIIIYNQTADFFNVSTSNHYLDINLNGTHFNFTTTTNKTITNIIFLNDVAFFTVNGSGILTTGVIMSNSSTSYTIYVDGIPSSTAISDSFGNIAFNFTIDENIYILQISKTSEIISTTITNFKTLSCNNISNYQFTSTIVFSLALMIFGLGVLILSFKTQNYIMIISGISIIIVGFSMIFFGNYLLTSILSLLC